MTDEEFERQYAEAVRRAEESRKTHPEAKNVFYNATADQFVVEFRNGIVLTVPRHLLPEFKHADPADLAEVELVGRGTGLHWEKLDQDFSIIGLIGSLFGKSAWMAELGRKGGRVTSEAKAAAARANGQKGGRPSKRTAVNVESLQTRREAHRNHWPVSQEPVQLSAELLETERTLIEADARTLRNAPFTNSVNGLLLWSGDSMNEKRLRPAVRPSRTRENHSTTDRSATARLEIDELQAA